MAAIIHAGSEKSQAHLFGSCGLADLEVRRVPSGLFQRRAELPKRSRPVLNHFIGGVPFRALIFESLAQPGFRSAPVAAEGVVEIEEDPADGREFI